MTTSQDNKLTMYQMVERYLLDRAAVVSALPNYTLSFTAFQACIRQINAHKQVQETNKGGLAEQKQQRKEQLVSVALDVTSKLKAYATFTGQTVLLREIDYAPSDLRQTGAGVLIDRARIILQRAQEHLKPLAEYRVTKELLNEFRQAITTFDGSVNEPRLGTVARKEATDALQSCFREADLLLRERLDLIVDMVRANEPAFFAGYQNARVLVERKGSYAAGGKKDNPPQAA
jgi:hypothetical protein